MLLLATLTAAAAAPVFGSPRALAVDPDVDFLAPTTNVVEGGATVSVDVVLSAPAPADVTIPYTVGGSADAGDGSVAAGPLVIPMGQSAGVIDVTLLDDAVSEGRERFVLTLGTPTGGVLGSTVVHEVVIDDDEAAATIGFDLAAASALEGAGTVNVTVTLSEPRSEEARVSFTQTGTAQPAGVDLTVTPPSPIVVPAGATTASVAVALVPDALDEPAETLVLSMLLPVNCQLGAITQHTLTIDDDDAPPAVGFAAAASVLVETAGVPASVAVELSGPSGFDVTVPVTVSGTATDGVDFTYGPTSLTILAGDVLGTVDVTALDDTDVEGNETVILTLGTPTGATLGAPADHTVTLVDDDAAAPLVAFAVAASSAEEDAGAVTVRIEASDYAAQPIVVDLGTAGSATLGVDYDLTTPQVTIPVGSLSADAEVLLLDDQDVEGDETIELVMGTITGATPGSITTHVLTVLDQDATPSVDFAVATSSAPEGAGSATVEVVLSHPAPADVTIPLVLSGSATLGGVDAAVAPDPLVIPQGASSGLITITLAPDALHEDDETIQIDLGAITGGDPGTVVGHTFTLADDDAPPVAQFTAYRTIVAESSGAFDVRVVLDVPSGLDVTLPFTVSGDAAGPGDISYPPAPLVIPAGDTFVDLPVTLVMDRVPELGERVLFSLGAPTGATLGPIDTLLVGIEDGDYGGQVALPAPLTPSAAALAFPLTRRGDASPVQTLYFSNLHWAPVTLVDVPLLGQNHGDFEVVVPGGLPAVIAPGQSVPVEVTFSPESRGARRTTLRPVTSLPGPAQATVELTGLAIGPTGAEVHMDTSSAGYLSPARDFWCGEYGVTGGARIAYDREIAGTDMDGLYRTLRFGPSFDYAIELPAGTYEVLLHAWEPVKTAPLERLMDVTVEGQLVLDDLDLFAEVGADAAWVSAPIRTTVLDGVLDLHLEGVLGAALLSAVEVRSIPVLSCATTALSFGTVDQGTSLALDVEIQNAGLHAGLLDRLTFRLGSQGESSDFSVTFGGVTYPGGTTTVVRTPGIPLPPGLTIIPVTFEPTYHEDHLFTLELESTGTGDLFEVDVVGTGGAEAGWGFLHPVPDSDPVFVVDYDQDGSEPVLLLGAESHTHEPGHSLVAFDWTVGGAPHASSVDTAAVFPVGSTTVGLTIGDDNAPQATATDTRTITVHPVDAVPGGLLRFYDGSVAGEVALLDAVPARPDHVTRLSGLAVHPGDGTVGSSPFTGHVMLTLSGQFDLASARNLDVLALGGVGHRLFVDGAPVTGTLALAAGAHSLEARFAVTALGDLPVEVQFYEAGVPVGDVGTSLRHDERTVSPVIHSMPTIGTDLGGNRIVISGFGFFPEAQTVVHWGAIDIPSSQFDKWQGEAITLTTPPGSGTVQVSVETPQGTSNAVDYVYSPTGPIPVRFDLLQGIALSTPELTSAAWGPNGKLYVSKLNGRIYEVTYNDDWTVQSVNTRTGVSGLTNHDTLAIAFNPFDTYDPQDPSTLKLYVSHGEQFQNGGGAFTGPSYFTGQVSVLTGPSFNNPTPIITQLPVSNHDHSVNGMLFDDNGDLLICVGGNTNAGVKWPLIGDVPESPLSGAIVRARLSDPGFNGTILYEDSVTSVLVDDQVYGEQVDVADGVDVEVYASGFRNALDLVLHTNGYIYATDNGPNSGYGPASTGMTTDAGSVHPYHDDELNLVEQGVYYGSANRARGRYDARQAIYYPPTVPSIPGVYRKPVTALDSSTNGITEYRAAAFNSAMRGDLIAMKWNFGTYRLELSADGRHVASKTLHSDPNDQSHLPNRGLDVLTGPGGAIIAVDYTYGKVRVQVPNDIAAIGLTPYDITPWRVPAGGGQPFVIGGSGFGTDLGQVSVTIGGVPASLSSVSDTRIRGTYPASTTGEATDLLDVVVTVGGVQRTLTAAARYLPATPGQATGRWREGSILPLPLGEVTTVVVAGKLYVFGQGDARTFVHDIEQGSWTSSLAQRPFPGNHHGLEVFDGKLYLMGGLDNGSAGKVQIYDIGSDTWSLGAPMPWNGGSCVTALIDGLIYVGGGNLQGAGTAANFAVYDPVLDTWTALAAMPVPVNHAASGTDGERLFVFGGRQGMNVPQPGFDDVQVYDPVSGTWLTSDAGDVAPMPLPRGGTGRAVYVNGEFYVMGGEDSTIAYGEVQAYDPVTDTWREDRAMPTPRHGIYPALHEGRVFVLGGGLVAGFGASNVAEVFSPR